MQPRLVTKNPALFGSRQDLLYAFEQLLRTKRLRDVVIYLCDMQSHYLVYRLRFARSHSNEDLASQIV